MPPAIYSASSQPRDDSYQYRPSNDVYKRAQQPSSNKDQASYSRLPQDKYGYNDRADNYGKMPANVMSEDGLSVIKPSSATYNERIPSANEYYSVSLPEQNPPPRTSTFQKASASNLANFKNKDYHGGSGQGGPNNEFFDKYFGQVHDNKKKQQQVMKEQLVMDLQRQMEMKKQKERDEKALRAFEDQRAEDRYVRELNMINEQSVGDSKKRQPNQFAEALNDNDLAADYKKEKEISIAKSASLKTIPREPEMHPMHMPDPLSVIRPNQEPSVSSKVYEKQRQPDMSFSGGREVNQGYGGVQTVTGHALGRDNDAIGTALQQYQQPSSKYQEYSQKINDFAMDRMDDKKRELRMNTNLLYQQLIDLRVDLP